MASISGSQTGEQKPAMLRSQQSSRWAHLVLAALGLTAAAVVVAMAGRAPLPRSTPVNASSAQAPAIALFTLLLGAGSVALAGLAALIWSGRPRRGDDEREPVRQPFHVPWYWQLVAIALPLALGAALVAAVVLGTRTVHPSSRLGSIVGHARQQSAPATPSGHRGGFTLPGWLPWTLLAIIVLTLGVGIVLSLLQRARRAYEPPERGVARVAVESAIAALDATTDARGAVIASYAAMERSLAERGVRRSDTEAPREYLHRVLVTASGTEHDARTLTGLFEEARFSTHPIPDRFRELAASSLRSLQARLAARGSG
jgi:Domain of unknown function (DUF4129)